MMTVTEAIEAAVAERGEDYVYPRDREGWFAGSICHYAVDGEPACIVGLVLAKMGLLTDEIAKSSQPAYLLGLPFTYSEITGLTRAQGAQDRGATWGGALHKYKEVMENA